MTDDALSRLAPSNRVLKRAQYEAFTFSLLNGDILIRNESHAEPSQHEYRVTIEDGLPTTCSCPANARFPGACKHRVAVAIRTPLLEAAEQIQLLADGGVLVR